MSSINPLQKLLRWRHPWNLPITDGCVVRVVYYRSHTRWLRAKFWLWLTVPVNTTQLSGWQLLWNTHRMSRVEAKPMWYLMGRITGVTSYRANFAHLGRAAGAPYVSRWGDGRRLAWGRRPRRRNAFPLSSSSSLCRYKTPPHRWKPVGCESRMRWLCSYRRAVTDYSIFYGHTTSATTASSAATLAPSEDTKSRPFGGDAQSRTPNYFDPH